ncbi:MAG: methionyl-tRNA formyltransferase [Myxococcales bacterium]|nr:methionyl-tRNA formyltransferase [Myxococcales bacterium]
MSLRYAFFGTPPFAVSVLDVLCRAGHPPAAVVCQPDRPRGRGLRLEPPPIKTWAEAKGLPLYQPERAAAPDFLDAFAGLGVDVALVAAYGLLLPAKLLEAPRLGFINVHPSLLPRYRGAAPVQWTLLNGDTVTGVSILQVTPRLDDGDILLQRDVPVDPEEDAGALLSRLALLGGELSVEALERLSRGDLKAVPQDESRVVWARALEKEDGRLDWNQPATTIHNRVRAVQPWPGAFCQLRGRRLKIHRTRLAPRGGLPRPPGEVLTLGPDGIGVMAADGPVLLLEVQLEGKKRLSAREFVQGRNLAVGDRLD